jgi:hypothetical protein
VFGAHSQEYLSKFIKNKRIFTITSYLRQTLDKAGKNIVEQEERYQQKMDSWDLVYYVLRAEFDGVEMGMWMSVSQRPSMRREGRSMNMDVWRRD